MNSPFPNLFSPLKIGTKLAPNRIVLGSMHTGYEDSVFSFRKLSAFLEARAAGGAGVIITGGFAPNFQGRLTPFAGSMTRFSDVWKHRGLTHRVKSHGGLILLQLLHAGRYAYHPFSRAPSRLKSPITPFTPKALSLREIQKTIRAFAKASRLAQKAGYDGVEIMGSEGYLLNQFVASVTNKREDEYGGTYENRIRFPLEIVRAVRDACGKDFVIVFRISLMDLIEGGSSFEETVQFAKALELAGVDAFNSGIGWHESRIPTIASMVPRGAFREATAKLKAAVHIPIFATNRIPNPELAEEIIAMQQADAVTLARPLLADPDWANKAKAGDSKKIIPCIACNQECLDRIFNNQAARCLMNPFAGDETNPAFSKLEKARALHGKKVAVVGAGPAGLETTLLLARLGADVTLFEKSAALGGQFLYAMQIPGKEEYREAIRYFENAINLAGGKILKATEFSLETATQKWDSIFMTSGVAARTPNIPGVESSIVIPYNAVFETPGLRERLPEKILILGGGGVAVDVATWLLQSSVPFHDFWKTPLQTRTSEPKPAAKTPSVLLFQRSFGKIGLRLGKTTSWIHRESLKREGLTIRSGVEYSRITEEGLFYRIKPNKESPADPKEYFEPAGLIILCTGQVGVTGLSAPLRSLGIPVFELGGAKDASDLDAARAIREARETVTRYANLKEIK